jgi:hypothetical protein
VAFWFCSSGAEIRLSNFFFYILIASLLHFIFSKHISKSAKKVS